MSRKLPTRDTPLTKGQLAFVKAYLASGGNGTEAMQVSAPHVKWPAQQSARMLRLPHVRTAVMNEATEILGTKLVAKALGRMGNLVDAESEGVQFQASKDLLDRAGFRAPEQSTVRVMGDIRIDLSAPSRRREAVDGTHSRDVVEGEGGLKTDRLLLSTPQPLTTEDEKETD